MFRDWAKIRFEDARERPMSPALTQVPVGRRGEVWRAVERALRSMCAVCRPASPVLRSVMRAKLVPELVCSNFVESLRFYTELLGFRVLYSRTEERFAYLERDGAELMLEQSVGKDRLWPRAELAYPFGRGVNLQIQVADALHLHVTVLAAGIAIFLPLEERWYRRENDEIGVKQFAIQDPDGYLLRFSQVVGER